MVHSYMPDRIGCHTSPVLTSGRSAFLSASRSQGLYLRSAHPGAGEQETVATWRVGPEAGPMHTGAERGPCL